MRAKSGSSGHVDDLDWGEEIDRWLARCRHPHLTTLFTPLRRSPTMLGRPDLAPLGPGAVTGPRRGRMSLPSASVAVVTYERPTFVARCLDHLLAQTAPPSEIIVVDSSPGDETRRLVRERFPSVRYEVCPAGRGATATARNIGYTLTSGEVLAFIDDDAYAEPEWLERLLPSYEDPAVGGVGGRQIRHQPGELEEGVDTIGRLRADGTLTGHFAADPGGPSRSTTCSGPTCRSAERPSNASAGSATGTGEPASGRRPTCASR